MEGVLAITFIFGGGALFLLAISPVVKALAARIQHRVPGSDAQLRRLLDQQQAVLDEIEGLRQEVGELAERVDFTERLLARQNERGALAPGSEAS